jgi:hypothetical protein
MLQAARNKSGPIAPIADLERVDENPIRAASQKPIKVRLAH